MSNEPYTEPPDYSARHASSLQLYNTYLELRVQELCKQITGLNKKVSSLNKLLDKAFDEGFEFDEEES